MRGVALRARSKKPCVHHAQSENRVAILLLHAPQSNAQCVTFGVNDLHAIQCTHMPPSTTETIVEASAPHHRQKEFLLYVALALALALGIRFFIAAPYVVSGASMADTFDNWHYLIVDRISYRFENPERGDVIIFKAPAESGRAIIKRVIGLPGETVILSHNFTTIVNKKHPEGFLLEETYLAPENIGGVSDMHITLGDDQFFVLGDNRRVSFDSRAWGPLSRELIL